MADPCVQRRATARRSRVLPWAVPLLVAAACSGPFVARPDAASAPQGSMPAAEWEALLAAEDARLETAPQLETVRRALGSSNAAVRALAVRAVGRSERAGLATLILPLFADGDAAVRIAAAHALADVTRGPDTGAARTALVMSLQHEDEPAVIAARAESLGRLHADSAAAAAVTARLTPLLGRSDAARLGALLGLYFLARQPAGRPAVSRASAELARIARGVAAADATRAQILAIATLAAVRGADESTLNAALQSGDAYVRREAAAASAVLADTAAVRRLTTAALRDPVPTVRYEGVRVRAARLASAGGCTAVVDAVRDRDAHVALLALDLLGTACRAAAPVAVLDSIAARARSADWHRPAHALVALASVDPARASAHARTLAVHPAELARAWAARAATVTADTALLYRLARDPGANVRTAATAGLARTVGHVADAVYMAQLSSDESELLLTAAAALEGAARSSAPRLMDALERVTALRRETSRDARVALLERLQELGDASLAPRMRALTTDFDSVIAQRAARLVSAWTGTSVTAAPRPLPAQPLPSLTEAASLAQREFVLEMEDGGEVAIRLLPFSAPTNAMRFVRLARAGYFDGLTIHRVAPNFVVQGGSPGANEYSGAGPFTRDELGASNLRGTVGLSTRGRDTGDAQFFINLVDNIRLDHEYTVFGVVASGMDVVDSLLEGAVIRRVRERPLN